MTVYDQPKSTLSDTGPDIRVIADVVKMIDPHDTPLIVALGGLDGARSKLNIKGLGTKIEWIEDSLSTMATTVNNTDAIATDSTSFKVADGSLLKDSDIITIDSELMIVKSVATDTITVYARNYSGTNATHATNAAITIEGMSRMEGDTTDYRAIDALNIPYNYMSILEEGLKITASDLVKPQWGIHDQWDFAAAKKIPDMLRKLEKMCFNGVRAVQTASVPSSMGGLLTFVTNNYTTTTGKILKTMVDDLTESIYADGGNPDLFVCHPGTARDLRDIYDVTAFVQTTLQNTEFGMQAITTLNSQWGPLRLVQSRFCPTGNAFILDSSRIGLYTYRPFGWHELGRTGDFKAAEVVGEFSFAVANDKAHGYMSGIST